MSKQLPKKAVYAKFQMNTAAKEKIDADISRITIVNEITPAKINIPAGEEVRSFFVLLVALKKKDFDEKTVATLSKLIPQNILFVLEFEGQSKLAIYHTKLMQTDWKPTESCTIELRGLNLDKVWENIVVDIGGVSIADGNSLDEQIAADERRQKIEKEIAKLEKHPEVFDPAVNPYAVRVVITGSRPDPSAFGEFPHFISFDGFIDVEYTPEQLERVALISEPFCRYAKWKGGPEPLPAQEKQVIEQLIAKSHKAGKPIRFWCSPDNAVAWETFRKLGIDIINTDQPEACTLYFQQNP